MKQNKQNKQDNEEGHFTDNENEPFSITVKKSDYNTEAMPMDLVLLDDDLGGDFLLTDIEKFAPKIISKKVKGTNIIVTFSSEKDLIKAARKFNKNK